MMATKRRESMELQSGDRCFRVTVDPLKDTAGDLLGAVHILQEITDLKGIQEELLRERDRARKYIAIAGVAILTLDQEGTVTSINLKGCELLGGTEKNIVGKDWFGNFIPVRHRVMTREVFGRLMAGEVKPVEFFENPVLTLAGEERLVAWHNTVLRDGTGRITGTISSGEDVTERRRMESLLRIERDLSLSLAATSDLKQGLGVCLEAALRASGLECGGIYRMDPSGRSIDLVVHRGFSEAFVKESSHYEVGHPLFGTVLEGRVLCKPFRACFHNQGAAAGPCHDEKDLRSLVIVPIKSGDRVTACLIAAARAPEDIGRHSLEALLALSAHMRGALARLEVEDRYRTIVENLNDGLIIHDFKGRILEVNDNACRMLGYGREELIGSSLSRVVCEEEQQALPERMERLLGEDAVVFEGHQLRKDGSRLPVEVSAKVVSREGDGIVQEFVRDIGDRRRSMEALRESEGRFRSLAESSPLGIVVSRPDGGVTYVNPALLKMTGLTSAEFQVRGWLEPVHPDDRTRVMSALGDVVSKKESRMFEHRMRRPTGDVLWVVVHANPVLGSQGDVIRLIGTVVDVTEDRRLEEELREREIRFRATFEQAAVGIAHVAPDGRWLRINGKLCEIVGYPREELLQMTLQDITHPDDLEADLTSMRKVLSGEIQSYSMEKRYFRKDGAVVWVNLTVALVRKPSGEPDYFISVIEDIAERRRADSNRRLTVAVLEALNRTRDRGAVMRHILDLIRKELDLSAVGIRLREGEDFPYFVQNGFSDEFVRLENHLTCVRDGHLQRDEQGRPRLECTCGLVLSCGGDPANPMFTEGGSFWSNDTAPLLDLPADQDPRFRPRNRCVHAGYRSVALIPLRSGDQIAGLLQLNDVRPGRFTLDQVRFLEGIGHSIGITLSRMKSEDALRDSLENLALAQSAARAGVWNWNMATGVLTWSPEFYRLFGIDPAVGASFEVWRRTLHPEDLERAEARIREAVRDHRQLVNSYRIVLASGETRWIMAYGDTTYDPAGTPVRMAGVCLDITAARQAESAILRETALLEAQLNSTEDGILIVDPQGKKVIQNRRCIELWKIPEHIVASNDDQQQIEFIKDLAKDPEAFVARIVHLYTHPDEISHDEVDLKDGTVLARYSAPVVGPDGAHYGRIWQFRDITDRKRAEEAIRTNEAQLSNALRMARAGHWVYDVDKDLFAFNDNFYRIFRTTAGEVGGYTMSSAEYARRFCHPDDMHLVREETQAAIATPDPSFSRQVEHRILYADGEVGHILVRFFVVKDSLGRTVKTYGVNQDITERKRMEEERVKLQEQLRQSSKMEAIGQLAGGVAHDFNNLLTVINGYSEILLGRLPAQDPLRGPLEEISKAGDRAAQLTRQLLAFGRKQVLQLRIIDLNDVLEGVGKMLRRLIREDIELDIDYAPGLKPVKADPLQVEQVILNLAVNARDAMPHGGRLGLSTATVELDEAYCGSRPYEVKPGSYVMLRVSDTGTGMDEKVKAHLFEPFFTTKEMGKGTGLGLATLYGIVKQSGGHIDVESEVRKGTTFRVYFPCEKAEVPIAVEALETRTLKRGLETILLVEDVDSVREVVREQLRGMGYRVLTAGDGRGALEIAGRHRGDIRLIVTDMVMPGMSGLELVHHLRRDQPGLKALIMSGYAEPIVPEDLAAAGIGYLQKPFEANSLILKVREALDQGP
jgi:PAS domain S-box-containing protein